MGRDGAEAIRGAKSAENHADLSSCEKIRSQKIFGRGLGGQQKLLISDLWRGRLRCRKGQFEVVDDAIDRLVVGDESDELHRAAALRASERVDFINLAD